MHGKASFAIHLELHVAHDLWSSRNMWRMWELRPYIKQINKGLRCNHPWQSNNDDTCWHAGPVYILSNKSTRKRAHGFDNFELLTVPCLSSTHTSTKTTEQVVSPVPVFRRGYQACRTFKPQGVRRLFDSLNWLAQNRTSGDANRKCGASQAPLLSGSRVQRVQGVQCCRCSASFRQSSFKAD